MFKKIVSIALTAAQVALIAPVYAAETAPANSTIGSSPEFTLLEGALALEGQDISPQKFQSDLAVLFKQYALTAKSDGAEQRLSDALVQLHLYNSSQANVLVSEFDSASRRLQGQKFTSESAADRAIAQEVSSVLERNPSGAEFSACGVATISAVVLGIGGGLALLGAGFDAIDALNNNGYSGSGLDTATGTEDLALGGVAGVAMAVGLVYLFSSLHTC